MLFWSGDRRPLLHRRRAGRTPLVRVDAQSGKVTEVTHGDQAVLDFTVNSNGAIVAVRPPQLKLEISSLFQRTAHKHASRISIRSFGRNSI